MTAPHDIDPKNFLANLLTQASPGLMRQMLTTFLNALLSAEADSVCGADYGTRSDERTNRRNGYRHRDLAPPRTSSREVPPPAPAPSTSPSPSSGKARTSPTGSSNAGAAQRRP